ncbi:hypothetical protein BC939DRAFT_507139 [Gamsiella multidivaricata]|uniref:uncharacterized protein n=1 Tax=Gamsiella multidivaricata TaxID=101098 RepID=UPI0022210836|nr:uncharacterized protein BC939DRAFT_507139 [Gamsiella multidivaricata]KAG0364133.1 hypothetical protein BGZ54_007820 [Gamsiella multidivaricata]KAI7817696.1 hypothetical protein BC939DRAFT_507139 [Gamsiella multidivaricata]
MALMQGSSTKSEFSAKNRTLLLLLISSIAVFIFSVQFHWAPYLRDFNLGNDTLNVHENDSLSPSPSSPLPPSKQSQLDGENDHNLFLTVFPARPPSEGERFLAYLPHSGFHNQRIALENALRLAAYLDRTLLLPPLFLSHIRKGQGWSKSPNLFQQWAGRNKTRIDYCRNIDPSTWPPKTRKQREDMTDQEKKIEQECLFYHAWTMTPWTYFYDIPKILEGIVGVAGQTEPIRVFDRPVMTLEWLVEHLGIRDPSTEIYFYNDSTRFSYRIVDDSEIDYSVKPKEKEDRNNNGLDDSMEGLTPEQIASVSRYEYKLFLTDLQQRPEKVLHFGSLYDRDRVEARSERHKALRSFISYGMDLWNQAILNAISLAEKQMDEWREETGRAAPGFLGVHFRTEDGGFVKMVPKNLQRIIAWLGEMLKQDRKYLKENDRKAAVQQVPAPTISQKMDSVDRVNETQILSPNPSTIPSVLPKDAAEQETSLTFLERCKGAPPQSPMTFMATDVHQPRQAPLLRDLLNRYPCTMFLSDFPEAVSTLERIRNPTDGVEMMHYMIPLIDATLAAKGREFQGTESSTFTAYIMDHLWPEYHPDRAVETTE